MHMWTELVRAAEARARQQHLRESLDNFAAVQGALADADIDRLIDEAWAGSSDAEAGPA